MKIPMGDNENSKLDSVFEETKCTFVCKESTKCEEKDISCSEKVAIRGEKGDQEIEIVVSNISKGDEKGGSKSKRNNRASMMRRSLSEVTFCVFYLFLANLYGYSPTL